MIILRTVLPLAVLFSLTTTAIGDLLPGRTPLPTPPMVAPVKIVEGKVDDLDPDAVAKIIIPSSLLPELNESSLRPQASKDSQHVGMVIAGLAISALAMSVMFLLKDSPHQKKRMAALIGCVLLLTILVLSTFLSPGKSNAAAGDPPTTQSTIIIEIQQDGHEVTLILPSRK